jgi:hypothetical protein
VASGKWVIVDGSTIRYSETVQTPEFNLGNGFGRWPDPTHSRHQFLTFISPSEHYRGAILYRIDRAPWVTCRDEKVTYKRAFEILANPEGCW